MQVKVENNQIFSWKKVEEVIQLAFQEHPHANTVTQESDIKNHDIHNFKKVQYEDAIHDPEIFIYHQEGSKEYYEGNQSNQNQNKLTVKLQGTFDIDLANHIFLTLQKSTIPTITVQVNPSQIRFFEQSNISKDAKLVVEILFAQKSHSSDKQKYKIYKSGITGCTRKIVTKPEPIQFKHLKINYPSSLDKNSKIMIALYHYTEGRKKVIRQIMISRDLFIIEQNKFMVIDSNEALHQYFELFGPEFMDTLPTIKLNRQDKHMFNQQINNIQKYLIKKNKKFLNIVYLSFKFPHFCELYFKMPEMENQQNNHVDPFYSKKSTLTNILLQAANQIEKMKSDEEKPQLLCNYIHPLTKLIFRINVNLRRVRIFLKKQFTEILSIVVSEEAEIPQGFQHFGNAKELKQFYLQFYNFAKKCKNNESMPKSHINSSSGFLNAPQISIHKKNTKKGDDDEQYHKQQEDDLSDQQESVEVGVSKEKEVDSGQKKIKRQNLMLKKLYANKKVPLNNSPKQNKYPTRNKMKSHDYQQSENNNQSKKNTLSKKLKQKEIKQQQKKTVPINLGIGNSMMPFQVIPQAGQNPIMGVFPMMQNAQKKDGQPISGAKIPIPMPIGVSGIPGMQGMHSLQGIPGLQGIQGMQGIQGIQGMQGMQGIQGMQGWNGMPINLAGNPGMIGMQGLPANMALAHGFGGMPMNLMNQQQQQQQQNGQKKESAKQAKDEQPQNQAPKVGIHMIPIGQGMGGMQVPMMGGINGGQLLMGGPQMIQGQMGIPLNLGALGGMGAGQGIPVMGPNGQIMMMQMMPQQIQQLQQSVQGQNQNQSQTQGQNQSQSQTNNPSQNNSQNTSNSNTSNQQPQTNNAAQIVMQGGIPITMMPGMQGIQGMQGLQGIQGIQALQGLQGMQGLQGIQGMPSIMMPQGMNLGVFGGGNPQVSMMTGNNPNAPNPNGQSGFIGLNQLQQLNGANGMPLNLLMPHNAQQQNDKNKQTQNKSNNDNTTLKKTQSGKKDEKSDIFPPPIETNNTNTNKSNNLPSFLTPTNSFLQVNPNQNKQQEKNQTNQAGATKIQIPQGQLPPGMLIPSQIMQLQQSQGGLPQGVNVLPQGMNIIPANSQQFNNLNQQQKMVLMQMMGNKMNGMSPLGIGQGGQIIQLPQLNQMGQIPQMVNFGGLSSMFSAPSSNSAQQKKDQQKK